MDGDKLKLLTNRLPVYADDIPIYSPLLIDIAEVGLVKYHEYVSVCTINVNSLTEIPEGVSDFDVLTFFIVQQEEFLKSFLRALKFFTKLDFDWKSDEEEGLIFFNGEVEVNKDNYKEFMKQIKFVNCLKDDEPEDELDEFDKQVLEMEKLIAEEQGSKDDGIPLQDLISAVCNMDGNGLSVLNIWDINIYSFYEQMKRGQLKENYFVGIQQLLAGADSKEVDIKYYIQKSE